jgi:hypothetical protein
MSTRHCFFAASLAFASVSPAVAANVIDQYAPDRSVIMVIFSQADLAQSFKQAADNVSGAGIFLHTGSGGGGDILTISLWDALPNAGGTQLASGSTALGAVGVWADVFWSPVAVTPETTYFLVFDTEGGSYAIAGDTRNRYTRGMTHANAGFVPFSDFDYTFRSYADGVAAVPEPASWALMIAGFGLVGGAARRRREIAA